MSFELTTVPLFNPDLDDDTKDKIIEVFGAKGLVTSAEMRGYFEHYQNEMRSTMVISRPLIPTHQRAIEIFDLLKTTATKRKDTIVSSPGEDGEDEDKSRAAAAALDLGVRIMLSTCCRTRGTYPGDVFRPEWRNSETLKEFVGRAYPRYSVPADETTRNTVILSSKFTAHSLKNDSRITIEWTDRLSDHLALIKEWRKVYIFRYPCYLKMCLRALSRVRPELDQGTAASLALGSLSPTLLIETLCTYDLLFSNSDQDCRAILREASRIDPAFAKFGEIFSAFSPPHNEPRDARSPDTIELLYKKFPHWGERLKDLWKEIDNPTPATRIERWSEKRKSPRWTTWWVVLGLIFAILFGVAATMLGALQVWISWCSWMDDPTVRGCSAKAMKSGS